MTWLYVLATVVLFAAPLAGPLAQTSGMAPVMQALVEQSGVPNLVSGVILETRLFDTIGEVVVFTLASIGVRQLFREETKRDSIRSLTDLPSRVVCEQVATISSLVAVEMALRGHLSPGGGFAAGVAGGTAIGLVLISGGSRFTAKLHKRWHADRWEKAAVLGFVLLALLSLEGMTPGLGRFGGLLSGGWIPLLNLLVALKVTLGSWAMVQRFIQYRGLL
jgi:multicomponent Na+:H+ antiporter subunit B